ncbi:Keratin-associated protein 13-1 [Lemmus lemmus]
MIGLLQSSGSCFIFLEHWKDQIGIAQRRKELRFPYIGVYVFLFHRQSFVAGRRTEVKALLGCCSGSFSSRSYGGQLHYPYSSCGSSYARHRINSSNFCSPRIFHLGSSLHSGCRQSCFQPIRRQTSHVVHTSCQRPCYRPRVSSFCRPCRTTYTGSLGFGSSSCYSLGYGSRSFYTSGCGSSGFRPTAIVSLADWMMVAGM